jgi:hypothetical protein
MIVDFSVSTPDKSQVPGVLGMVPRSSFRGLEEEGTETRSRVCSSALIEGV